MCRRTNDIVLMDAAACDSYQQLPKCKFCANYSAGGEGLNLLHYPYPVLSTWNVSCNDL